jgi:hypothetical protein
VESERMKSNKELTMKEFHISNNIKCAMNNIENPLVVKEFLIAALRTLHR